MGRLVAGRSSATSCSSSTRPAATTAALAPPGSYRDYLAWLSATATSAAAARAWRDALAGLAEPTLVGPVDRAPQPLIPETCRVALPSELSERLRRQARGHGVTLNTVLTAAWGIVLADRARPRRRRLRR